MINFKDWLLKEDIFGFEKNKTEKSFEEKDKDPIIRIDAEIITEALSKMNLNGQVPFSAFPDEIQWGKNPGAIKMVISPLGSFKNIIRKLQIDLEGNQVWVCKKVIPYRELLHVSKQFDEDLAIELFEIIEETNKQDIESFSKDYNNLERLTIKTSNKIQANLPKLLIFRGIKEIRKNENYLIFFEYRGHGAEAPGSARVEQFVIEMNYNSKNGVIRSMGYEVQSPMKGHRWIPQPSEWDEYFSTSQSEEEISKCISSALGTY